MKKTPRSAQHGWMCPLGGSRLSGGRYELGLNAFKTLGRVAIQRGKHAVLVDVLGFDGGYFGGLWRGFYGVIHGEQLLFNHWLRRGMRGGQPEQQ